MIDVTGRDQAQGQGRAQRSEVDFVALQPGQTIGRYEIVAVLGQGGFGITYRARDAQLNRDVAIKEYLPSALAVRHGGTTVLPRSTRMSDDFTWGRQRFVDEGRTLATLQRAPAIVRVFDFLEDNGTAYIVMELVPGHTLEDKLKAAGKLGPAGIERILWPLLDGLEQVHATGFLHRDIKPANILLDADGNPTLIDFGASRAAIAGRSTAMTAIFTPGYAAAEQMTSARQGPWTDIYGLSATMYHAIAGSPPPSAFDRMLEDRYEPLAKLRPEGFVPGLLVGIDSGLVVRAAERPQSIAGWRPILGQAGALGSQATVALGKAPPPDATAVVRGPAPTASAPRPATSPPSPVLSKRRRRLLIAAAVLVLLALGRGGHYLANHGIRFPTQATVATPSAVDKTAQEDEAKRQAMQQELDQLRKEKEARDKAAADEALKKKIEAETRAGITAEMAAQQKAEEAARQKAAAEEAARSKAHEDDRRAAEAAETALHLSLLDRQHIQVALTALGFNTNGTDGVFGGHTRDMIAAWQKSKGFADTSFLTGPENQALLRDAGPALAKFDDDQKKAEAEKAKADTPAAAARAAAAPQSTQSTAASAPPAAASGPDGLWRGRYHCSATTHTGGSSARHGGAGAEFTMGVQIRIIGGSGTWVRPGSGPGTRGNQSLTVHVNGSRATVTRSYIPANTDGTMVFTGSISATFDGNAITGQGQETNGFGRICEVNLMR
jgi:serine/threonine protein kinase/peptidoglycan hydrolase-like protein with peptidoglycan-binding domain